MVVLYLISAALLGATLGAHTVIVWHSMSKSFLFVELGDPFAELKKPVKSILQGLWRLAWAVGFMLLQIFLWVIGVIVMLASMFGLMIAATAVGVVGFALLGTTVFHLQGGDPQAFWPALYMIVLAATYGLSAYVGRGLVDKEESKGK